MEKYRAHYHQVHGDNAEIGQEEQGTQVNYMGFFPLLLPGKLYYEVHCKCCETYQNKMEVNFQF